MTLTPQDLRIGNILRHKTRNINVRIVGICANGDIEYVDTTGRFQVYNDTTITALEPIPLTTEMMITAGFEQTSEYAFTNDCMTVALEYFKDSGMKPLIFPWSNDKVILGLRHLHELQNLYHAVTGEELNVKL